MVNTVHTTVAAWMVGAGGDFSNTNKLIYDARKLGAELGPLSERRLREHPQRGMYPLIRMLAVLLAVHSSAVMVNMSTQKLKWPGKRGNRC